MRDGGLRKDSGIALLSGLAGFPEDVSRVDGVCESRSGQDLKADYRRKRCHASRLDFTTAGGLELNPRVQYDLAGSQLGVAGSEKLIRAALGKRGRPPRRVRRACHLQ